MLPDVVGILVVTTVSAAGCAWEGVKALTLMHWLLIVVILSLGLLRHAITSGFEKLARRHENPD